MADEKRIPDEETPEEAESPTKSSEQSFTKEEQRYFEKLTEYSNKGG